ncbi:CHRD domain-containing protein [Candidatus Wolfebacteria bacterium]|nr:CHRD domain-containing protein [Candidatus Wolfebacteria bacterium]
MKNTVIWIVVILVIVLAIFWFMNRPDGEVPTEEQEQEQEEEVQSVTVSLSEQNDSGMSGVAILTEVEGGTHVALNLTGAPEGVAQPAHIHTGSCAAIGEVVYPLESPVNGVSETLLNTSLDSLLISQLPLALNVHKSAEEVDVYVACGDLDLG